MLVMHLVAHMIQVMNVHLVEPMIGIVWAYMVWVVICVSTFDVCPIDIQMILSVLSINYWGVCDVT